MEKDKTALNDCTKIQQSDYQKPCPFTPRLVGIMFSASTKAALVEKIQKLQQDMKENTKLWLQEKYRYSAAGTGLFRLAFVAKTAEEVTAKCEMAVKLLVKSELESWTQKEITYCAKPIESKGKITVLFSGQGTQQVNMLSEMLTGYPQMCQALSIADRVMMEDGGCPVSELLYPIGQTKEEKIKAQEALQNTENTQPALAAVASGLYIICKERGLKADYFIGHSFGELAALWADGVFDTEVFIRVSKERGKIMSHTVKDVSMMAVMADKISVQNLCKEYKQVHVANENSPKQTVVSGNAEEIKQLEEKMTEKGMKTIRLKVSGAFHSPYMREASREFRKFLNTQKMKASSGKVIANSTGDFYARENISAICDSLEKQLLTPVLFQSSVKKAYDSGSRIFVEIGNGRILTNLIRDILANREHETIALCSQKNKDSMEQFEFAMARLAVLGMDINDRTATIVHSQ